MTVSAVVVSHGHARELERSLPALAPQVDELVVIANLPGSVGAVPEGVRVLENERPLSFAANVNRGVAETAGELVVSRTRTPYPEHGAVAELVRFADEHPRAGLVGPLVLWPDGTWQPSLRRFPTVVGTIWRRTPLRLLRDPYRAPGLALRHPSRRAGAGRLAARRRLPADAALDARRARRLGRRLPPLRRGHRPRLPRRAGRLGALARAVRGRPPRLRRGRSTSASSTGTRSGTRAGWLRFLRKHPERLRALR